MFSSIGEGPFVDISLAQDLMMIGFWCDGSLNCFLLVIFSLLEPGSEKNGMGKKWGTFENVETQNKHEVSSCYCSFKMHLAFSKYWLGSLIEYLSW